MNKKYTVRTELGEAYCILSAERGEQEQFMELFGFEKGHGMWAGVEEGCVIVEDYFCLERLAAFPILSIEETDEPVSLKWTRILRAPEGGLPS